MENIFKVIDCYKPVSCTMIEPDSFIITQYYKDALKIFNLRYKFNPRYKLEIYQLFIDINDNGIKTSLTPPIPPE